MLTAEKIVEKNHAETKLLPSFFEDFAKKITVYQDDDIWVVDKPHGLLSVDGRELKVSLQSRLLKVEPNLKLIHRLDMDTSGLIIFAKNTKAQTHISKQFIERLPQKQYQALVFGTLPQTGEVDVPVRYEPSTKPRHIVDMNWHKHALTKFESLHHELRQDLPITRVALYPITGRSHQLRVHMLHLGHVMLGDPIYANGRALALSSRLCLHAHKLRLKHPNSDIWMDWQSTVPF
ncbi:ribosomal large subunit pseudouridine synthase A [Moraxella macacae 0408225]|uniref:Dual-specificity RNA pseudouridine synthase RluA n=2 Tax=Pseudomonadota TaxID=1224 RepID=L2F714_9GAMM|nr:RluA family pseudouridine synthase [Moraxella macacae]ELA08874.1 ribosomal large subunit pseudouridine synthase A [Moraxella macacae 0408225]